MQKNLKMASPDLSVVMPVTLTEHNTESTQWRNSPELDVLTRLQLALQTYEHYFPHHEIEEFLIVTPDPQVETLKQLVALIGPSLNATVISEQILCSDADPDLPGWYLQQLIKLAASEYFSGSHYLTIDSDIVCVRPFAIEDLITDGRARMNLETVNDYLALYKDEYAQREVEIKALRYQASARLLGYRRNVQKHRYFYGETPVVLHRSSVQGMLAHLEQRYQKNWQSVLCRERKWTEYGLYFQFLEATGQLNNHHEPSGCDTVLDLKRSIWQASEWYREAREYDQGHFQFDDSMGLFVAIQSWLETRYWLPARYSEVGEFYQDLKGYLGLDGL